MVFRIELERQNGVYYAGEVVKGKVVLEMPNAIKCRGLRIRLLGQSRCHWHHGSGDSRTDYDGRKTFQDHRITLLGNFYNSDVIDEGGSDPDFGIAMGEGVLYVPCDNEAGPQELIIRVMDYDWGKRDDLLGEMVLKAADLVAHGAPNSYTLNRKGQISSGKGGTSAGITLSARVMPLNEILPSTSSKAASKYCLLLEVHSCRNLRKADWAGQNDVYVQAYYPPQGVRIYEQKALPAPEMSAVIPQGPCEFPFVMPLRIDAPGSAEVGAGDYSYVRYYLHASIDLVGWVDPASRRAITVLPSSPMPTPAALMPASSERMGVRLHKCSFCFCRCCKLGAVDITLRTGRQSYAIGERIDIPVSTVVNHSKDELEATLVLVKYILLTQTGRVCSGQKHGSHRQVAVLTTARVTPGQTLRDCCRPEPIMPPTAPSFFGSRGRAWGGEPVTWTYALELHVRPVRRAFGETISAEIPVLVSAAPPYPYQVPHGSDGSVLPVDVSALDPWSIASKAATAGSASHPGQLLSGAEDTMGMAKLVAMGTPVVVATPVEAKQIEDQSQLVYQPFELQWPQSLDQWPTPPPPNSSKDKSSTFSNLEEALRASNDRRTTVGEWVNNSPTAASMLTPKQVATVLSGASLSLEQPSIARELSLGLTGHLKCAHVRAALDACPFAKTDVALAMAPFVTDPDKRSEVLTMLVSFDRQRVEDVMMRGTGN